MAAVAVVVATSLAVSAVQKLIAGAPLHVSGFGGAVALGALLGSLFAARSARFKKLLKSGQDDLRELERAMEALPVGIACQDRTGALLWRNQAARKLETKHAPDYCFAVRCGRDSECASCIVRQAIDDGIVRSQRVDLEPHGAHQVIAAPYRPSTDDQLVAIVAFVSLAQEFEEQSALRRQLAHRDLLLREIHHRMKNNLQLVSSLISLQYDGTEPTGAMARLEGRIRTMAIVHEELYQRDDIALVNLRSYLDSVLTTVVRTMSPTNLIITPDLLVDDTELTMERASALGLIVNELATNSIEHAFAGRSRGLIRIRCEAGDGCLTLGYSDDGTGITRVVRKNESMGMRLVEALTRQLNGSLLIPDSSTGFEARLQIPHVS